MSWGSSKSRGRKCRRGLGHQLIISEWPSILRLFIMRRLTCIEDSQSIWQKRRGIVECLQCYCRCFSAVTRQDGRLERGRLQGNFAPWSAFTYHTELMAADYVCSLYPDTVPFYSRLIFLVATSLSVCVCLNVNLKSYCVVFTSPK